MLQLTQQGQSWLVCYASKQATAVRCCLNIAQLQHVQKSTTIAKRLST